MTSLFVSNPQMLAKWCSEFEMHKLPRACNEVPRDAVKVIGLPTGKKRVANIDGVEYLYHQVPVTFTSLEGDVVYKQVTAWRVDWRCMGNYFPLSAFEFIQESAVFDLQETLLALRYLLPVLRRALVCLGREEIGGARRVGAYHSPYPLYCFTNHRDAVHA